MSDVHQLARAALDWLAASALDVAVLVVVVALLQRVLRRWLTPRWSYALWLLVPIRLVLPVAPESPLSLRGLVAERPSASAVVATVPASTYPDLDQFTREEALQRGLAGAAASASPPASRPPAAGRTRTVVAPVVTGGSTEPEAPSGTEWPWQTALVAAWLAGAASLLGWTVVRHRRFAAALAGRPSEADARIRGLLERARVESGVRPVVELVRTDLIASPAVFGVRRPRILVPGHVLDTFDDEGLLAVLRHELAHVRCRDGLANWGLAIVRALHWHNPLVWFALARLCVHRESARDWLALEWAGASPAHSYGSTLIRLLEGLPRRPAAVPAPGILERHDDLRRRVTMITRFRPSTRRGLVLGGLFLAGVVCLTFTRPPGETARAQEEPAPEPTLVEGRLDVRSAVELRRVRVERERPMPGWEAALRRQLASPVTISLEAVPVAALIDHLRTSCALNVIVAPECRDVVEEAGISVTAEDVSVETVLRWALHPADLDFCLSGHAVYVGPRGSLPEQLERRFYDVRPLLGWTDPDGEGVSPEDLLDRARWFVAPESWEGEGVSIAYLKGLLLVDQTAAVHEGVEGFLNLLLNRGRRPATPAPAWRRQLDERLGTQLSVRHEGVPLREAASLLGEQLRLRVLVPEDVADDVEVDLHLSDVPAREVIAWLARFAGLHVSYREGTVALAREPDLLIRAYPLDSLLQGMEREPIDMDLARELMVDAVAPASWELEHVGVEPWCDLVVVKQTEAVHAEIQEFFAAMRRTLDD